MNAPTLAAVDLAIRAERARAIRETYRWTIDYGESGTAFRVLQSAYPDVTVAEFRGQAPAPDAPPVLPTEAKVRTCECDGCDDPTCDGQCDSCDDSDCSQCHGDNCDADCSTCHDTYECCGYCDRCDSHHDGYSDEVCDRGHCHDCNHCCEDC